MAAQDYDAFYRLTQKYGDPYKIEIAIQILYVNHGEIRITGSRNEFSGYFRLYKKHKDKFDASSKKCQLLILYYIRDKPMSLLTLLKLLSIRNLKRYVMARSSFRQKNSSRKRNYTFKLSSNRLLISILFE